jgi:TonB-dependent SusC/RagA subfamily outer membrane receptor
MIPRLAIPLALVVVAGCAEKLVGPDAQAAAREYQSKSIAPDKTPLVFVDGKELPADSLRRFAADQIESVEVLKGPKAIGLYGARAQNGVIYVVTKR